MVETSDNTTLAKPAAVRKPSPVAWSEYFPEISVLFNNQNGASWYICPRKWSVVTWYLIKISTSKSFWTLPRAFLPFRFVRMTLRYARNSRKAPQPMLWFAESQDGTRDWAGKSTSLPFWALLIFSSASFRCGSILWRESQQKVVTTAAYNKHFPVLALPAGCPKDCPTSSLKWRQMLTADNVLPFDFFCLQLLDYLTQREKWYPL